MQNYNKILLVSAVILLTIPFFVFPYASAAVSYCDGVTSGLGSTVTIRETSPYIILSGSTFVGNGEYLSSAEFELARVGDLTDYQLIAVLYDQMTGEAGTDMVPDFAGAVGTWKEISDPIDANTLQTTPSWIGFNFSSSSELVNAVNYGIAVLFVDDTDTDDSHYLKIYSSTTSDNAKNSFSYNGNTNAWSSSTIDKMFKIWTNDTPSATPTPSPTPTAAPTTNPTAEMYTYLSNLITLIVPLLVIVLPAFFGYKYAGAWGFLAGINIGAILAYVILGSSVFPLWGIVVILILDALLLFGKVGFHS